MSDWLPSGGFPKVEVWGASTAASSGTTLTANATANVYGSFSELIASTGIFSRRIMLEIADASGTGALAIDIAVGASGSEVVIAEAIHARMDGDGRNNSMSYALPISVPAGVRVSARLKSETGGRTVKVVAHGVAGDGLTSSFQGMTYLGSGYTPTNGYSANTKGAWAQLIASTARQYKALHVTWAALDFVAAGTTSALLDLAVGAASSEVVLVENLLATGKVGGLFGWHNAMIEGVVPSASRLSFRGQVSVSGNAARFLGMYLHGYY